MNSLSVRISSDKGLTFELIVDGQCLGDLIEDGNEGIPYWIIEDALPPWPPHGEPRQKHVHVVSVCSCGEYGCGHTRCHIEKKAESVIFYDFEGDIGQNGKQWRFEFARENYDEVVLKIVQQANAQKKIDIGTASPPGTPASYRVS